MRKKFGFALAISPMVAGVIFSLGLIQGILFFGLLALLFVWVRFCLKVAGL